MASQKLSWLSLELSWKEVQGLIETSSACSTAVYVSTAISFNIPEATQNDKARLAVTVFVLANWQISSMVSLSELG